MADIFAKRSDWLLHVDELKGFDVMTIHPRDGLTGRMIVDALAAQKMLYVRPGQPAFLIREHGTKILIQREVE